MKKRLISLAIAAFTAFSCVAFSACNSGSGSSSSNTKTEEPEVWTVNNILERPVEKDDVRIGSYVCFSDTGKGWSGVDQVERLHYAGLNFMPMICTLPKSGVLTEEEQKYITRDLTDGKWWGKIDELMTEYNMVYYFSELSGLANDHESSIRRESMINDEALKDARTIIPQLKNCVGVKIVDEPAITSFPTYAKWAKRYAAITDANGETIGLDALVNHIGAYDWIKEWANQAGSTVGMLSYDAYPFSNGGTNYGVVTLLNQVRVLAKERGMRIAVYPQSCNWNGFRMPNLEEIRWHVNSSIALGATQLTYFNYTMYPSEGCADAVFGLDGSVLHPEILEGLTKLNKEIRTLDSVVRLSHYNVVDAYATKGGRGLNVMPSNWTISSDGIKDLDLMFTVFEAKDEYFEFDKYINVVNNSTTDDVVSREVLLGENSEITGIEAFNAETGKFEPVGMMNGAFELSIEKGGSVFLKISGDI